MKKLIRTIFKSHYTLAIIISYILLDFSNRLLIYLAPSSNVVSSIGSMPIQKILIFIS